MQKQLVVRAIVLGAVVMLMGMNAHAIAGMGGGNRGMGGTYSSNLTDEQISQMAAEKITFMKSTQELRDQIREKTIFLKAEQSKKAPDTAQIASLQNELTNLRSQFNAARQQHMAAMKQIDPNFPEGRGGGRGHGGGMGMGYGNGMGEGHGKGYCMNY